MPEKKLPKEILTPEEEKYGKVRFTLDAYLRFNEISKNKVMKNADVQRTQLLKYCNNKVTRIDLCVLARICHYLRCDISDIMMYFPPKEENE